MTNRERAVHIFNSMTSDLCGDIERALDEKDTESGKWKSLAGELRKGLELTAVRFTPALDGYCWCSRKGEPSSHKELCLLLKTLISKARAAGR